MNPSLPRSAAGPHSPWLIAVIVSIATFMEVLDTTIANVSLRHIAGGLAASREESTWILTSYLISNAVVLPISGWLSNVIGRKRFYMICVVIFTLGSALCSFAGSLGAMVVFRIIQGVGGGGLAPTEQSMFADSFPPEKRAQAFALYGLTVVSAPAIGPILGGWLTESYSWHWVFLINIPVGVISLLLTYIYVHEPAVLVAERAERLRGGLQVDYIGFALVLIGFASLQLVFDRFDLDDGFSSSFVVTLAIVCIVALSFLVVWEWQHPFPVMDIRLFSVRSFAISNAVMFLIGFMLISTTQLLPQMTQELMGYDATTAGETLGLGGVATLVLMPAAGIMTGRLMPPKYQIAAALVVSGLSLLHMSHLNLDMSFGSVVLARMFQVVSLPFLFIGISAQSYVGISPRKSNEASAILNLTRNLGGSLGVSLATTLLARRVQFHHARLAEHVTPYDDMHGRTLASVAQSVQVQASLLSYLDVFHFLAVIALVSWPLVLLLKTAPRGSTLQGH